MNFDSGFAIAFLGIFGAILAINQVSRLCRTFWPPISRCVVRNLVLPRVLRDQNIINPTRAELLCYVLHWVAVIFYNTWRVTSIAQAASRAGIIAVVHIVPLSISHQLSFLSSASGLSLDVILKAHRSMAIMATLQAILHGSVQFQTLARRTKSMVFQVMALSSLSALTILPVFRRLYGYELFLYSHRVLSITLFVGLWKHVHSVQTLSGILLACTLGCFLALSIFQVARQVYRNMTWNGHGFQISRTLRAWRCCCDRQCRDRQHCEQHCIEDCPLIVEIRLSRPWIICPGQYIHLTLLTDRFASIFQRHPFVITWWEDEDTIKHNTRPKEENPPMDQEPIRDKMKDQNTGGKARIIYVMIDPQHGWTQKVVGCKSLFINRSAWIDGPFGAPDRLHEYETVVFFASGSGIFAQLPLLKGLVEGLKSSAVKTRTVKLIWQTNAYHQQLATWMDSILLDDKVDMLIDICVHLPRSQDPIEERNPWVSLIHDDLHVGDYIPGELERSRQRIAVTVSGHQELRQKVRLGVMQAKEHHVRLYELPYQPRQKNMQRSGATA